MKLLFKTSLLVYIGLFLFLLFNNLVFHTERDHYQDVYCRSFVDLYFYIAFGAATIKYTKQSMSLYYLQYFCFQASDIRYFIFLINPTFYGCYYGKTMPIIVSEEHQSQKSSFSFSVCCQVNNHSFSHRIIFFGLTFSFTVFSRYFSLLSI